jgi:uncharacterized membrane protein YdbT with pleckstrin-like domain
MKDAEALRQEFLRSPHGEVRAGSLIVRPSLKAGVGRFLVALSGLVVVFAPLALGVGASLDEPGLAGVLAAWQFFASIGGAVLVSLAPAVQLAFTRYVLDDEGIRERVQILSKSDKRIQWEKVTALQHRRTLLDRALRIERLDVIAYGERGATLHLVGLHDAAHLRNLVAREMRRQANVRRLLSND